jgi:hypothetical protein
LKCGRIFFNSRKYIIFYQFKQDQHDFSCGTGNQGHGEQSFHVETVGCQGKDNLEYCEEHDMEININLKPIDESNFIDAFNLQLAEGQEQFVSHPLRSLAQAYVYRNQ